MAGTSPRRVYLLVQEALGLVSCEEKDPCTFVSLNIGEFSVRIFYQIPIEMNNLIRIRISDINFISACSSSLME